MEFDHYINILTSLSSCQRCKFCGHLDGYTHSLTLGKRTIFKNGRHVRLTEATTMQHIATHTSIPVPKNLDARALNGSASILMECIERADTLEHRWPSISNAQKKGIFLQLKEFNYVCTSNINALRKFACILNQYIYVAYYYYIGATNNTESWGYYCGCQVLR